MVEREKGQTWNEELNINLDIRSASCFTQRECLDLITNENGDESKFSLVYKTSKPDTIWNILPSVETYI